METVSLGICTHLWFDMGQLLFLEQVVPLWYPSPRGFLLFFLGKFCDANCFFNLFHWHKVLRAEEKKPLAIRILTFWPLFLIGGYFYCSVSHMIGWIKYLWGCDWSKEIDIFDNCQVLSQHESEILNDLDKRLSFLSARCVDLWSRCLNSTLSYLASYADALWDCHAIFLLHECHSLGRKIVWWAQTASA